MHDDDITALKLRLMELQVQHQDLDDTIARLAGNPAIDQLELRRLKRRKLALKDEITYLRNRIIPDLDA